ncbi:Retrovirus-related Pol polyprotein from type-1 retrotransposable element R2 [Araneus ventricosus]|uniref:Retrovirus-related Pol polyprotein from type-1 retrotransposable element R2 n=1 Tax=Araneus ventricosus TaxID=182803 RepID=A0A4Y2UXT1_ARAVE|nr:Retrovirus-related Pol polyprotein from type-1 retrotransposable element R2 [Araneus ventricosus]
MRSRKQTERQQLLMESSLAYPRGKEEKGRNSKERKKGRRQDTRQNPNQPDENITDPSVLLAPSLPNAQAEDIPPPEPEPGPLTIFCTSLQSFLQEDPSDEAFANFCDTIDQAISEVQKIAISDPDQPAGPIPPVSSTSTDRPARRPVNVNDAQSCQKLYRRNPKRAVREIVEGEPIRCDIPTDVLERHFTAAWNSAHHQIPPLEVCPDERPSPIERQFTIKEVSTKLSAAENTSPGPDRITYFHWRSVPQSQKFLTLAFNCCLHFQKIPPSWKTTTTVLIPKKDNDLADPANWRPIALSSTIYKLFTKVLAGRLSDWCEKFRVLSPSQKGFTPFDGVLEHNFILQTRLERARTTKKDLCVAWLDVTNAFDALPHDLIYSALSAAGAGSHFISIIQDIYSNCVHLASSPVTRPLRQSPLTAG